MKEPRPITTNELDAELSRLAADLKGPPDDPGFSVAELAAATDPPETEAAVRWQAERRVHAGTWRRGHAWRQAPDGRRFRAVVYQQAADEETAKGN